LPASVFRASTSSDTVWQPATSEPMISSIAPVLAEAVIAARRRSLIHCRAPLT
jgi:hypothetical protein